MTDLTSPTPPKPMSKWMVAATCSAFVLLLAVGGMFAMRDQLLMQLRAQETRQAAERQKLATRLDALASKADEIAQTAKPDMAPVQALDQQLSDTNAKLEAMTQRVAELEKAAAEKKAAPTPAEKTSDATPSFITLALSGKPFAEELASWQKAHAVSADNLLAIEPFATKGIPSEHTLVDQLRSIVEALPSTKTDAPQGGFIEKVNTHFAGLISIKKTAEADPYESLRRHAGTESFAVLLQEVEQLPEAARAPFTAWLNAAHERAAAVSALTSLAGQMP